MNTIVSLVEQHLSKFLISCICRTIDITEENKWFVRKRLFRNQKGAIFCHWHNRLFFMTHYIATVFYHNYPYVSAMASGSRDGRKIANVINLHGGNVILGSSSRRSRQALREAVRHARNQQALFLTPDGPRGPRYKVQKGIALIAKASGQPVIPITYGVSDYIQLNSWDRFIIPCPFTNGVVIYGDPIWPETYEGDTDALCEKIQVELDFLDQKLIERGVKYE